MKEEAKIIFAVGQSVEPKKNESFLIGQCVGDLISRQAAIDALMPIYKTASTRNRNVFSVARKCLETIENLPSAEPKKGKWIPFDMGKFSNAGRECSNCGKRFQLNVSYSYCPMCGADMRGEHDE